MSLKVLILEENLMWSVRLARSLAALGYEAVTIAKPQAEYPAASVVILNLGSPLWPLRELVPAFQASGTRVLGHAGHKEKELHELGRELGCDLLCTNSELTHKLPELLKRVLG